ncbi:cation:proton antiporter [Thermococcus piezophilus]|uniref:Cation/H+ exchanger transmembrane domain-containing protein n=1 Tax=Thermococcus piezophilus TaxID=1712654 RepID=A0A172WGV0_9EURY|nr:cation:proton antiporter [Thermococcus piezophilus]ANF22589.1 hypothetical protein A7C91_04935 [Thermococcus piezophilus]
MVFSLGAIASKVIGCGLEALLAGLNRKQSLRIRIGMIPRMGVELAMLAIAMNAGIVDEDTYVVIVLMIFLSTLVTPPLLKMAFGGEGNNEEKLLKLLGES